MDIKLLITTHMYCTYIIDRCCPTKKQWSASGAKLVTVPLGYTVVMIVAAWNSPSWQKEARGDVAGLTEAAQGSQDW